MKKDEKQKLAEALKQELSKARSVILTSFEGLHVAEDTTLRRQVAQTGAKYKVYKNSLIERAVPGTPAEPLAKKLRGTTSVSYTETDPVSLAKILTAYAKENPAFVFKAGVVEGRVVSMAELMAISSLPPLGDLQAKILFLINSPAQRVASVLAGVARNLAVVIQQGVKEKKFKEST
jgi:large subunit ribosomal protein L10